MTGSVFYAIPETTSGLFLRGGTIFSTLICKSSPTTLTADPIIMAFSDVQIAFQGRGVMTKHKAYGMYRPSVVFIAQTLADLPIIVIQLAILDAIVYFLGGLQLQPGLFFAFLLFSTALTGAITAMFRAVGYAVSNYNDATKITGGLFTAFVVVRRVPTPLTTVLWLHHLPAVDAPVAVVDPLAQPDLLQHRSDDGQRARWTHV